MSISFQGYNEQTATFKISGTVAANSFVKLSSSGTVQACATGDIPVGRAISVRGTLAAVQLGGYIKTSYSGTAPIVGYATLSVDANGGLAADVDGRQLLVVEVDTTAGTLGILF